MLEKCDTGNLLLFSGIWVAKCQHVNIGKGKHLLLIPAPETWVIGSGMPLCLNKNMYLVLAVTMAVGICI